MGRPGTERVPRGHSREREKKKVNKHLLQIFVVVVAAVEAVDEVGRLLASNGLP